MDEGFFSELFDLNGDAINTGNEPLIKKTRQNADNLLDGLNALLVSITKEAVSPEAKE